MSRLECEEGKSRGLRSRESEREAVRDVETVAGPWGVRVAFTAPVMVAGEREAVEGWSAAGTAAGDPAHPRERRQTPKQSVSKAGRSRWI